MAAKQAGAASISLPELQAMGRFLLSLQHSDGSFIHRYSRSTGSITGWESLYYPGEAALGFLSLYKIDGSRQLLIAASKALEYLAASRSAMDRVPPDHWSLIATADLLPLCNGTNLSINREALLRHAAQIVAELLREQNIDPSHPALVGSFDLRGRTAPTATSVEGLLAALTFLPPTDTMLQPRLLPAAGLGIAFLLRSQLTSGPYSGAVPEMPLGSSVTERSLRIDVVQHTVCAYLRYRSFLSGTHSTGPNVTKEDSVAEETERKRRR